jgi:hypothetical protein
MSFCCAAARSVRFTALPAFVAADLSILKLISIDTKKELVFGHLTN